MSCDRCGARVSVKSYAVYIRRFDPRICRNFSPPVFAVSSCRSLSTLNFRHLSSDFINAVGGETTCFFINLPLSVFCNSLFSPGATQPIAGVYFTALYRALASSRTRLLAHTQRRATVGRTPLNEWSVRRRDLYLTTLTTDKHPCPGWDSNPRSQQASGRRPTP